MKVCVLKKLSVKKKQWQASHSCSAKLKINPLSIPMFIAIIAVSGWIVNVFSGGTRLSCPSTPQPSSHPWSLLECHHVSISVSWVWGPWAYPSYVVSLSHNRKFFSGPGCQTGQGRKEVVPVQFMAKSFYLPCQISHCSMGCCQVLCRPLSVLTKVNIRVIYIYIYTHTHTHSTVA